MTGTIDYPLGTPCRICTESKSLMHSHHTIPRSRGGENSEQIPLCSSCHDILHANALALVSKMRNKNKKPLKVFWSSLEQERNAQPYLQVLVKALILPVKNPEAVQRPVHFKMDSAAYEQLKLLQAELGLPSIEKTILSSIKHLSELRGISNGTKEKTAGVSNLWFMRGSEQHKDS